MRSSTILAIAVAAVAGPAFAVPIAAPAEPSEVESGVAIDSGAISTFTRFAAPLIGIMNFKNSQRREALDNLFARAEDSDGESGAGRRLDNAANIADIGSSLISAWQSLRGREDLFARAEVGDYESGAGRRLDNAASIAGIGSSLLSAWQSLRAREDDVLLARDIEELFARGGPNRPSSGRPLLVPVGPRPRPGPRSFDDDALRLRE